MFSGVFWPTSTAALHQMVTASSVRNFHVSSGKITCHQMAPHAWTQTNCIHQILIVASVHPQFFNRHTVEVFHTHENQALLQLHFQCLIQFEIPQTHVCLAVAIPCACVKAQSFAFFKSSLVASMGHSSNTRLCAPCQAVCRDTDLEGIFVDRKGCD